MICEGEEDGSGSVNRDEREMREEDELIFARLQCSIQNKEGCVTVISGVLKDWEGDSSFD